MSGLPAVVAQAQLRAQAGISSLAHLPFSNPKSEESGWRQTQQSQEDPFSENTESQIRTWWSDDESNTNEIIAPTHKSPSPTQVNLPTDPSDENELSLWDEFVELMV